MPKPDTFSGLVGEVEELPHRRLKREVCEKYRYQVGTWRDQKCHIAPFYDEGRQVGQKIRFANKQFDKHNSV